MDDTEHPTPAAPRGAFVALAVTAILLVVGGWVLPLWTATLHAPQYPGGLTMRAYGHQVTGDVGEISGLNHYVGMRAFDLDDFPEMALWPPVLVLAAAAVLIALFVRWRWVRRAALVYLWATPVGVLAVIQVRLHQYGQDLDPGAALRMDPFTPWVVGPTKVWNFVTWSWPGLGVIAIVLAAAVVTFGPRLVQCRGRVGAALAALVAVVTLAPSAASASPGGTAPAPVAAAEERVPTLAELVAGAAPGQRVVVPPGTFAGNTVIDVPVVLEGRGRPTIVGDGTGSVITVRAPGTVIRGLEVRGSGPGPTGDPAGIRIEADDVTIEDVVVRDSYMGIAVHGAGGIRIVDNVIHGRASGAILDEAHALDAPKSQGTRAGHEAAHGSRPTPGTGSAARARGDGVWLHGVDHVLVRGNHIHEVRDGIYVSFGSGALIDTNTVVGSRYAVHSMFADDLTLIENHFTDNLSGAVLMYRGPALLLRNTIRDNRSASTGFGLLLKDVVEVQAVENLLVANRVGIHVDGPAGAGTPAMFAANTVAHNAIGVAAYPSARAVFRVNSFVGNTVQVLPQGGRLNHLVFSDRGFGNLWSTYAGYQGLIAGRGAVPHTEGGAVDRLLGRNPELFAIANGPALRLLRSVEERWGRQDPVLIDELPIVSPLSPALPVAEPDPAARTLGLTAGALLTVPFLLLLPRRPRRRAWTRHPRAIPI